MDLTPADIGRHFSAVSFNEEGGLLLGTSSLSNRYWNGSLWYFNEPETAPDITKCTSSVETDSGIVDAKWHSKTHSVIAGCDSGGLVFYSYEKDGRRLQQMAAPIAHDDYVTSISLTAASESPRCISTSQDKSIRVWDISSNSEIISYKGHHGPVKGGASHPSDENLFASCGSDGRIIIWDFRSPKPAKLLGMELPSLPTCLAWQPNSNSVLAVGVESGSISVLDLGSTTDKLLFTLQVHNRAVNRLAFSPLRPDWLGSASNDCSAAVSKIEGETGRVIYHPKQHSDFVLDLCWHPVDNRLFTCGYDSAVLNNTVVESESLASPLAGMTIVSEKEKSEGMDIGGDTT